MLQAINMATANLIFKFINVATISLLLKSINVTIAKLTLYLNPKALYLLASYFDL
jgi:hypothetical protein